MTPSYLALLVASLVAVVSGTAPRQLRAQTIPTPDSTTRAAIDRIAFLEGAWRGSGWIAFGPERRSFTQREEVRLLANRSVLLIEGHGTAIDAAGRQVSVHDALAAIHYDRTQQRYGMRAWRGDGVPIEARIDAVTDTLRWGFSPMQGVDTEYIITRSPAGEWLERGYVTRAGTRTQFFEMRLTRVP